MNCQKTLTQINNYENILKQCLSNWLENKLSSLGENWWNDYILEKVPDNILLEITQKNIADLSGLNLTALLKIIDINWIDLSQIINLNENNKDSIKNMIHIISTISNHSSKKDLYMALITMKSLLAIFDNNQEDQIALQNLILEIEEPTELIDNSPVANNIHLPATKSNEIKVGSLVTLVNDPNAIGAVVAINGMKYSVLINNQIQSYYQNQLILKLDDNENNTISLDRLRASLTAHEILHTGSSSLYSLNTARIDFVPYQFRPALKIINSDSPRLLIADDVGVGKTIETGLIVKELESRSNIESILVICPKPLIVEHKWKEEMKRFDEDFVELDSNSLRECITEADRDGEWPDSYKKAIIPYSIFNKTLLDGDRRIGNKFIGLSHMDFIPHFDIVIVDEAHHIRNADTYMYECTELFCRDANAVVFLTATPLQNSDTDLFTLLNVLRPDLIYDKATFSAMLEPNKFINQMLSKVRNQSDDWNQDALGLLRKVLDTEYGKIVIKSNPNLNRIYTLLNQKQITREEKIELIGIIEKLHTLSGLINRTRRRDIDNFCIRRTETVLNQFSNSQRNLYDSVLDFESTALSYIHATNNVVFMMCTIMRQAASCIYGLAPFVDELIQNKLNIIENDGELYDENISLSNEDTEILNELVNKVHLAIESSNQEDSKFDNLYSIIQEKASLSNNKIIVFSSFRHTLRYLTNRLTKLHIRCAQIDGSVNDIDRRSYTARFKLDKSDEKALDVLLFSEVGCEGLDYQFCDTLVNYDLPWNPMRIEQRIGRIDRRGQKSDTVTIYNLITSDTIDAMIYERCLSKIGVFENSIGDCAAILGDINTKLTKIMLDPNLTEQEKIYKIDKMADNDILRINEIRNLEENEKGLFGFDLTQFIINSDVKKAESQWISPDSLCRLLDTYLNDYLGTSEYIQGKGERKNLRLAIDKRTKLLNDLKKNPVATTRTSKYWKHFLRYADSPNLPITFDSNYARDHRDVHFITQTHPLIQQAAKYENTKFKCQTAISINDNHIKTGVYPFLIYSWEYLGLEPDQKLIAISNNKYIQDNIIDMIMYGSNANLTLNDFKHEWENMDGLHYEKWSNEMNKFKQKNILDCNYRIEQLKLQYNNRFKIIQHKIDTDTNSKIMKMHEGQLNRLEIELEDQILKYQDIIKKLDIHSTLLIEGVVEIINNIG